MIPATSYKRLLEVARGVIPADLVFKGGLVINVFSGELEAADLAVTEGFIVGLGRYAGRKEVDVTGRFLAPGLIDPHLHIESSMLSPAELTRIILPRGTTTIVADPHEIANVLGIEGIRYLLKTSQDLPLDIFFMAPSCVPATHLETSGAELLAADLEPLLTEPRILGLAEVMNFPGVIHGFDSVWDKLRLFQGRPIDGHAPLLSGPDLNAYLLAGIATDHECTHFIEAKEKLARGMCIFIREGSQAKNLVDLLPLVTEKTYRRTAFCTDDRSPEDLIEEGHLDHVIRLAIKHGIEAVRAVIMSTLNPAETYGLKDRGALAPGRLADIVVLKSLHNFEVDQVYKRGALVAAQGEMIIPLDTPSVPAWASPMSMAPLDIEALTPPARGPRVRVIEVQAGQILTGQLVVDSPVKNGRLSADPARDLSLLLVVERHKGTGNLGLGLVKGLGIRYGALASSVAHDSHNIVAAGVEPSDLLTAIDQVKHLRGGLVVVADGRVLAQLPLPIAGLLSLASAQDVAAAARLIKAAARQIGSSLENPFSILSFLALPVIPRLKLTDRGLVDVERFTFTDLFVE